MKIKLTTFEEAKMLIKIGKTLLIAGDESLLKALPRGNWIGGTIPYFMAAEGGVVTKEKVFINEVPLFVKTTIIREYDTSSIHQIYTNAPKNGFTFIIIPAKAPIHYSFALATPKLPDYASRPLAGWISGVHLSDLETKSAKVFNGMTGNFFTNKAVAMEIDLPTDYVCEMNVVNIFYPGDGDTFEFLENCFAATRVLVNGKPVNFCDYLLENKINTKLPLVTTTDDFNVNVSFQSIDPNKKTVNFFAPVFQGIEYKLAAEITHYAESLKENLQRDISNIFFSGNCILNFLYAELENNKTSGILAPITFGEIAYKLLNQSLVSISLRRLI